MSITYCTAIRNSSTVICSRDAIFPRCVMTQPGSGSPEFSRSNAPSIWDSVATSGENSAHAFMADSGDASASSVAVASPSSSSVPVTTCTSSASITLTVVIWASVFQVRITMLVSPMGSANVIDRTAIFWEGSSGSSCSVIDVSASFPSGSTTRVSP